MISIVVDDYQGDIRKVRSKRHILSQSSIQHEKKEKKTLEVDQKMIDGLSQALEKQRQLDAQGAENLRN